MAYRNGDHYMATQDYYERVNTHTALGAFDFSNFLVKDVSKLPDDCLQNASITCVHFTKSFGFATLEAENEYLRQRSEFLHDNETRDEYIETFEGKFYTLCAKSLCASPSFAYIS